MTLSSIKLAPCAISEKYECLICVSVMTHIDTLYDEISQSLRKSSLGTIPTCGTKHSRNYVIPGWNDQHQDARNSYVLWRNTGKPRQGSIADTMRRSRLNFKYALRQCQAMEDTARADAMAKSLQNKDVRGFWRSVSKHYNKAIPLATTVGSGGSKGGGVRGSGPP